MYKFEFIPDKGQNTPEVSLQGYLNLEDETWEDVSDLFLGFLKARGYKSNLVVIHQEELKYYREAEMELRELKEIGD